MPSRRMFLAASGAAALGACLPRVARATDVWPPYAQALAIDASSGFGRLLDDDDGVLDATDLADAKASGLSALLLTLVPNASRFRFAGDALESTVQSIARWDRELVAHPDRLLAVRSGADLQRAHRERKVGLVYGFQETSPLGDDLDRVDLFHALGVRVIQLTHNRRNLVGDGCMEPGNAGLSQFGHEVVERLNARRVLVDLAHGSQRLIAEGIAASKAPVLISHTGCRALADLPRNTGDAELRAMADRGGVVGIIFWPYLRTQGQPMASDVIRHIEHAIDVCGEDHVGIGTDGTVSPTERTAQFEKANRVYIDAMRLDDTFGKGRAPGLYAFIPDLNRVDRFAVLGGMLAARGHSDARIAKILGGNFARVMGEVWG